MIDTNFFQAFVRVLLILCILAIGFGLGKVVSSMVF